MKFDNYFSMKFSAIGENESFARSSVVAFCVALNPSLEEINDIKTAVSEAVTNSIVHGYLNADGEITLKVGYVGKEIHIEVVDEGVGIKDIKQAMQPFYTTKPNEERGGLGFMVMETVMDSLIVENGKEKGLIVKMMKKVGEGDALPQ